MALSAGFSKILLLVNLVIVVLAAGGIYYSHNMIKPDHIDTQRSLEDLVNSSLEATRVSPYKVKKQTINLYSPTGRLRFLDIEMNLLPFTQSGSEKIKNNENIVVDALIDIAGNMRADELNSVSGKILLENRLKEHIHNRLGEKIIKEIFFSRFVIQ